MDWMWSILACPEHPELGLVRVGQDALVRINERIHSGECRTRGGRPFARPLAEALVRRDGRVLYPIVEGIPVLLVEESVELAEGEVLLPSA